MRISWTSSSTRARGWILALAGLLLVASAGRVVSQVESQPARLAVLLDDDRVVFVDTRTGQTLTEVLSAASSTGRTFGGIAHTASHAEVAVSSVNRMNDSTWIDAV